jgi:4-cresol dehydrogenase (hydroxylating)
MGGFSSAVQEKHMTVLMEFRVYPDAEKNARRRDLFSKLVKACGAKGWGEYRAPVIFQDEAQEQFSFNDGIYRRFVETLYEAADPNGILSPGRMGIWPKHSRKG